MSFWGTAPTSFRWKGAGSSVKSSAEPIPTVTLSTGPTSAGSPAPAGVHVRCSFADESFFDVATPMGIDLGRTLYGLPTCRNLIIRAGEAPAAGAQFDMRESLGIFQCDGTLTHFRGEGLQTKLIRARLSMAAQAGCDLVTADTAPGSQSQHNYERQGFQVIYTKVTLIKPCF